MSAAKSIQFPGGYPNEPNHLKKSGKAMWAKGRALWTDGTLQTRDLEAWLMFCESFDELDHCDKVLKRDGEYNKSSQGTYSEHPALKRRRATEAKILRYQKLFGLVPEARKKRPAVQQGVTARKR
jgi:P27 family predicted phage terminase small subunit